MRIAVIMTCHNRAPVTCDCLSRLRVAAGAYRLPIRLDLWLNEDRCTDKTIPFVNAMFHSDGDNVLQLKWVHGSGADYWCGGMRRAWQAAIDSGIRYDGFLWLNDDTMLEEDALQCMFVSSDSVVVGATRSPIDGHLTYGGRDASGKLLAPNGALRECKMINGNIVYIPYSVFGVLGNFPEYFVHSLGDYDYARRANEHGIKIYLTSKYVGICDDEKRIADWKNPEMPFTKRLKALYSPLSGVQPKVFFRYNYRHDGILQAIRLLLSQHIRVIAPRLWK